MCLNGQMYVYYNFTSCLDIAVPAIMGNRVPLRLCLSDVPSVFRHMRSFFCPVLRELKGL